MMNWGQKLGQTEVARDAKEFFSAKQTWYQNPNEPIKCLESNGCNAELATDVAKADD